MIVPPLKIQGIKTKIVPHILEEIEWSERGKWIEPFLGSGVVLFNVNPSQALVSDTNPHLIAFYKAIQSGELNPVVVREYLETEGEQLSSVGEAHYYKIRNRFNQHRSGLDFLFLNRACFNGLMRFNKNGEFNTPFCKKVNRFSKSYITKICNQVDKIQKVMCDKDWLFVVADWETAVSTATSKDFVYADPPYVNRFSDYYNQWSDQLAKELENFLLNAPCKFIYSMWSRNKYRRNDALYDIFRSYKIKHIEHFYHLGSTENLRNSMVEALVVK